MCWPAGSWNYRCHGEPNPAFVRREHPRVGTPDDTVNAVAFLASPASGFINRQSIIVDGGLLYAVKDSLS
jgi:NAD(P)-dependent dehydrogenase (short-subunit alcohol dehydrogenase family)